MKMKIENSGICISGGVHDATIKKIVKVTTLYGDAVKFFFAITDMVDENGDEPVINGMCSANKLSTATKLYRWISAITGSQLLVGVEIDFDNFIGIGVKILVVNTQKNGNEYSNVTEIIGVADIPF